jgi:hypothetical protein
MFVGKARSLPYGGDTESYFARPCPQTLGLAGKACQEQTRTSVNYDRNFLTFAKYTSGLLGIF